MRLAAGTRRLHSTLILILILILAAGDLAVLPTEDLGQERAKLFDPHEASRIARRDVLNVASNLSWSRVSGDLHDECAARG
jgi:hypothetical protein